MRQSRWCDCCVAAEGPSHPPRLLLLLLLPTAMTIAMVKTSDGVSPSGPMSRQCGWRRRGRGHLLLHRRAQLRPDGDPPLTIE